MIRLKLLLMCFRKLRGKIPVLAMVTVFTTGIFAQQSDDDDERYKRDRYSVSGVSPSDRVFERDIDKYQDGSLTANDYVYEALDVIADFDGDYDDDIAFFRKLDTERYILVVISHYDWRGMWHTRETVLAEFDHDVSGT